MKKILIVICCLAFVPGCSFDAAEEEQISPNLRARVLMWREAVESGEVDRALHLAADICGDARLSPVNPKYSKLLEANGISSGYLTAGFNRFDFQLWEHAFAFKKIAEDIAGSQEDPSAAVSALFEEVRGGLEPRALALEKILWPYTVWKYGRGLCDRQAWVLCELAYQLGFETQIVYLRDPDTLISPHTIAEIRKGNMVWTADPYAGGLFEAVSAREIAEDPGLAASVWPGRESWRKAAAAPAFWLPAYPQDYCERNQVLQDKVRTILGGDAPRFGEPPSMRLENYLHLAGGESGGFPYGFWFWPVRLLSYQMIRKHAEEEPESGG